MNKTRLTPHTKLTFYHATAVQNLPHILRYGIKPRTLKYYHGLFMNLLDEYNINFEKFRKKLYKPKYVYDLIEREFIYIRDSRVGYVSLSGDKEYALQNALAGFEEEVTFRRFIYALKTGKLVKEREMAGKVLDNITEIAIVTVELSIKQLTPPSQSLIKNLLKYKKEIYEAYKKDPVSTIQEIRTSYVSPSQIIDYEILERKKGV
jgi:hypothetical protein